jgi:non-ribosomal peptide synthase domain TIGR01720
LEGHGREEDEAGLEVSRTVGWFTVIYPVKLDVEGASGVGEALKRVKEQLRGVPRAGRGYGLLRYLGPQRVRQQLKEAGQARVSFNYLGQLDRVLDKQSRFGAAAESSGATQSEQATRRYWIEVGGNVSEGKLQLGLHYSRDMYRPETIRQIIDYIHTALSELIAHCLSPQAGGFTPSDFPLASLHQHELETALSKVTFS